MLHNSLKVVVILGPTASGKTEWGIKLAKKFNGEIISADSRTVYKYFNIGSAKPAKNEMQRVKHHLLDFIDPRKKIYTAADFQRDALKKIKEIIKRKKLPLIVGGSALYLYALTRNYQFLGKSDANLRRSLEAKSLVRLQAIANKKRINLNASDFKNKRRLVRAIEAFKNLKFSRGARSRFAGKIDSTPLPYQFLKIGINLSREKVYKRIDKRTQIWMKDDKLIDEVKGLLKQKISKNKIFEFGLGYREVVKYLVGEIKSRKELIDRINFCQHAYVRRQMAWFKKDKEINWCKNLIDAQKLVNKFLKG